MSYIETYCAKNPGDPVCKAGSPGGGSSVGGGTGTGGGGTGGGGTSTKGAIGAGGTGEDSGNTFGGGCGSGFQCKGDAIQCAIAKDQLQRNCQTLEPDALGSAFAAASAAGLRPSDHPYNAATSVPVGGPGGGFDQTDLIGGSCPADQTFQVATGKAPVVIPFSRLCSPATWLGNILVGITALCCLGIVFVKGD